MSAYLSGDYWDDRSDLLYYHYIDYIMRTVATGATSVLDVGTGNCPYLEWFSWIPKKVSVDIRAPYQSDSVEGIVGDIHDLSLPRFDVCTCLQVLEHVPDAERFARRLLSLADLLIVSVPFNWNTEPRRTTGHIHDPVSYEKLCGWMGRKANYHIVVKEPFTVAKGERLIALFDRDPERVFRPTLREGRRRRVAVPESDQS